MAGTARLLRAALAAAPLIGGAPGAATDGVASATDTSTMSGATGEAAVDDPPAVLWRLDSLARVGGHVVRVLGSPRIVTTEIGPAVEFNGRTDGLLVEVNPLEGLQAFTIEIVFEPAADGPEEQRFLHLEEAETGNRALIELRMLPGARWCLDTFLRSGESALTLIDRTALHSTSEWHVAALTYDGRTMAHYVDGIREASGDVDFKAPHAGRSSIGVRQNQVSWFKGRIHSVRMTPRALSPDRLLGVPRE